MVQHYTGTGPAMKRKTWRYPLRRPPDVLLLPTTRKRRHTTGRYRVADRGTPQAEMTGRMPREDHHRILHQLKLQAACLQVGGRVATGPGERCRCRADPGIGRCLRDRRGRQGHILQETVEPVPRRGRDPAPDQGMTGRELSGTVARSLNRRSPGSPCTGRHIPGSLPRPRPFRRNPKNP